MKSIFITALKYFVFLFVAIEIVPYVLNKGDFKDIVVQTLLIAILALAISLRDSKKKKI